MKSKIIVICMVLLLALGAWAKPHKVHYASQAVEQLPPFDTVAVTGPVEVDFRQHESATVHVSGPQNKVEEVSVEVQDGVLSIRFMPQGMFGRLERLRVAVTGPQLHTAIVSGDGEMHLRGRLQVPQLTVNLLQNGEFSADGVTVQRLEINAQDAAEADFNRLDAQIVRATADGKADIELAGLALQATLENRGSGDIDAADLRVHTGTATVRGKGDVQISAYESLTAEAGGKGKIKYRGEPVSFHQSGNRKRIVPDKED